MAVFVVCSFWGGLSSAAEKYPSKPITFVVPWGPGGMTDVTARLFAEKFKEELGQPVLVVNKPGASGILGLKYALSQKADGYTVVVAPVTEALASPYFQGVEPFDVKDLSFVASYMPQERVLFTTPDKSYKTFQEFVEYAKKNPGALTMGGTGPFSNHHMATLRLQKTAGIKLTYVPFTGSAPMMMAVLGGHVAGTFANSDDLVKFKDQIRILGSATDQRFPDFPTVPTFKEMGMDIVLATDRGVAVPPGTPEPVIQKLEAAFLEIARNPEIQAEMKKQGFVPVAMGQKESKAYIEKTTEIFKELVADLKK